MAHYLLAAFLIPRDLHGDKAGTNNDKASPSLGNCLQGPAGCRDVPALSITHRQLSLYTTTKLLNDRHLVFPVEVAETITVYMYIQQSPSLKVTVLSTETASTDRN